MAQRDFMIMSVGNEKYIFCMIIWPALINEL